MRKIFNVGIVGCGNISDIYLINSLFFKDFNIVACADIRQDAAAEKAKTYDIKAMDVDEIFAAPEIDIILNLTVPSVHFEISKRALLARKHVYSEKPIALSFEDVKALRQIAQKDNLYVCSAPDTFLGPTHQYMKDYLLRNNDEEILNGTVHLMSRGMEHWHPNPEFFYKKGGGPILDIGPYYVSLLVYLLGPVRSVYGRGKIGISERTVTAAENYGKTISVETPTTYTALLAFESGVDITMMMSWDVWKHEHNLIELYGTKASYILADPNYFGGSLRMAENRDYFENMPNIPSLNLDNGKENLDMRGIGIADMCQAIAHKREARCGLNFAGHCFAVLEAILTSSEQKCAIDIPKAALYEKPLSFDDTLGLLS